MKEISCHTAGENNMRQVKIIFGYPEAVKKTGAHIRVGNFSAHKDKTRMADGQDVEGYATSILHTQNFCPQT